MLERAAEARERPRAVEAARTFLELVAKSVNAWEAIKPWVNHTQRLDLLAQVCTPGRGLHNCSTHLPACLHLRAAALASHAQSHTLRLV